MMTVELIDSDDKHNTVTFALKGATVAFANALRRTVLEEVPTMAIETVEFRKNSSVLYDEVLAHRMGLLPLTTDLESYTLPNKCNCKGSGCASCQVKLTLKVDGPATVYASDLKSKDPNIKPAYAGMPLVKLRTGQKLELEATAILGTGREHTKWAPGHIYYKKKTVLKIGKVENPEEMVKAFPPGILEVKAGKLIANEALLINYDLDETLERLSKGEIKVEETDEILFFLESFGQLSCKEIMEQATKTFEGQLIAFQKLLKSP